MTVPLIVHVIHHLVIGGMENGLVNLINRLPADRYRHAVLCIEDFSDFRERIRNPDVEVVALHRSRVGTAALRRALWGHFRRWRPDIVHSRALSGLDALLPALLAGVPARIHGEHGWDVDDLHGMARKRRLLRRLHAPLVHQYITVSQDLGRYLREQIGVAPSRISTICNGVDVQRFVPQECPDLAWLPPAFREPGVLRIGTVGRLQAVKDQALLIRAFALLTQQCNEHAQRFRLLLVGDGPQRQALEALAASLSLGERCHFAGSQSDVPRAMQALHLFALPSLNEGISNTILEAKACGLPVLATAVGGNPELLEPGRDGELLPVGDAQAWSDALRRYALDDALRLRHGQASRQAAEQRFSLESMVKQYGAVYERMLARH